MIFIGILYKFVDVDVHSWSDLFFVLVDLVDSLGMLQMALEISHRTNTSHTHTHTDKITLTHPISNFELFMMLDIDWFRFFVEYVM